MVGGKFRLCVIDEKLVGNIEKFMHAIVVDACWGYSNDQAKLMVNPTIEDPKVARQGSPREWCDICEESQEPSLVIYDLFNK